MLDRAESRGQGESSTVGSCYEIETAWAFDEHVGCGSVGVSFGGCVGCARGGRPWRICYRVQHNRLVHMWFATVAWMVTLDCHVAKDLRRLRPGDCVREGTSHGWCLTWIIASAFGWKASFIGLMAALAGAGPVGLGYSIIGFTLGTAGMIGTYLAC